MAKFDVYRLRTNKGYVLDCQADLLASLSTRLVVPLIPIAAAPTPAARLNPLFDVLGEPHVMATQFAATIHISELGPLLLSLRDHDIAIGNALDMLISGY